MVLFLATPLAKTSAAARSGGSACGGGSLLCNTVGVGHGLSI